MYSATPNDLIESRNAVLHHRKWQPSAADTFRPGRMVVGSGQLMMVVERLDRTVVCVRITGTGSLVVDQFGESSLTPMSLAYSPRTLLPEARDIPEKLLLQLEEDDVKRRDERRRKSRRPKRSNRIKG